MYTGKLKGSGLQVYNLNVTQIRFKKMGEGEKRLEKKDLILVK